MRARWIPIIAVVALVVVVAVATSGVAADRTLGSAGSSVSRVKSVQPKVLQTVTAEGVTLNAGANCSNADLDITMTTVDAQREYGLVTNLSNETLLEFEHPTTLTNFSGTYVGYGMSYTPTQPPGSMIGAYAYVGTTPPDASTTGEFFVAYVCDTQQVLDTCYGPYGSCPQTILDWQQQQRIGIPATTRTGTVVLITLLAAAGLVLLLLKRRG